MKGQQAVVAPCCSALSAGAPCELQPADTHYAVLDTEAQLISEVWPANEHHSDRRTPDDVHLDPGLRFQTLGGNETQYISKSSYYKVALFELIYCKKLL